MLVGRKHKFVEHHNQDLRQIALEESLATDFIHSRCDPASKAELHLTTHNCFLSTDEEKSSSFCKMSTNAGRKNGSDFRNAV